jgi:hypothetical protein
MVLTCLIKIYKIFWSFYLSFLSWRIESSSPLPEETKRVAIIFLQEKFSAGVQLLKLRRIRFDIYGLKVAVKSWF